MASRGKSPPLTVAEVKSEEAGRLFHGTYLLKRVNEKTAKNGSPFLSVELGDRTGSFGTNLFSDSEPFRAVQEAGEGTVVRLSGKIEYYRDRLSPKIAEMEVIAEEEIDPEALRGLVATSPDDPDELWQRLGDHIERIQHAPLRATVRRVADELGERFRFAPGAMAMHHAYRSGLLEHTIHMAEAAHVLLPLYPEVDPDLARAGILVHDVGKVLEYAAGLTTRKTQMGILHGHVVLGFRLVREAAVEEGLAESLLERLEHIILSHQGELAWGAATMAATPEAVFVSMVDNLDAKLGIVQQALRTTPEGVAFSEFMGGLQAPVLCTPPDYSDAPVAPPASASTTKEPVPQPDLFH